MDESSIGIIISLVFSALFSSVETAFMSSSRLKVELDRSKGTLAGKALGIFYRNESQFIAFLLLGNNISLVLFGLFSADLLDDMFTSWGITGEALLLLLKTICSTALVLLVAEFLPKVLVQVNPNGYLKTVAIPVLFLFILLWLPTQIVLHISNVFLFLFGIKDEQAQEKAFSRLDLEHLVQDLNERIKNEQELGNEMQILQNALNFDDVKARDCMVPRTEIIALSIEDDIKNLQHTFVETGKSKIIIYRDTIDNIIGYVHSFEMFKQPKSIKEILLPIPFVPEAMPGKDLLNLFSKKNGNIAVVVDEYGGTAGIVTLEDVIEEIFGEIEDEHDQEDLIEQKINDQEYLFSARHEIDDLNDKYKLEIPTSEEYETLGGFIIHKLETIPEIGTKLKIEGLKFVVEEIKGNRIETVRVFIDK